ncbi:hypothetical protein GP486_006916 [Trichoglossum hirsutum]|uniref:Dynactin subunit n=1 Tax=Trichoglossum hirsutum TaxID=265104 RepID=A0A9P8L767_9PEZI|nr:hypothetical protein GP486_006916 [Trichoglossum hirsutum]
MCSVFAEANALYRAQDSAPDVYETPELTDDVSTLPTSTARSASQASSYKDAEDDEDAPIDHRRLHPDQARTLFSPAQIDARGVDFSDRVDGKRRSYRASSRRRRKGEDGTEELGDFSDEEDETLERKLARLRREIEEVREEVERREAQNKRAPGSEGRDGLVSQEGKLSELSDILDHLHTSRGGVSAGAEAQLAQKLGTSLRVEGLASTVPERSLPPTTYTVTYAPSYQQTHALAKAADFDKRLALLEKALGINSASVTNPSSSRPSPAILPTLDTLTRQVTALSESSPSSLDVISRRVRQLTQEAEKLTEARKSAKAAQDALKNRDRSDDPAPSSVAGGMNGEPHGLEDPEQIAKINALYGTLATIESLSPMLPAVLDRLRSLRAIHADAATASESLARVEKQQEDMGAEIQRWKDGLEKVEAAVMEGEKVMGGNMVVIEGWVKDLEARMQRFGR